MHFKLTEHQYYGTAHISFCFTFFLEIFFPPSPFKELCESYTKMHVGCQVKHTLFVFEFYNNMSKTKDAHFYSEDA